MTARSMSPQAAEESEGVVTAMTINPVLPTQNTRYLNRPEGRIAYDVDGDGPLVVLVPGMGDLRAAYRFLAPALREAGYRVACTDLRGHGDSDTTFTSYGDVETARDVIALVDELGCPAVIVGNSMGAGSAVIAAAQRPDLVSGLVLIGPFVRNGNVSTLQRLLLRVVMARTWAATSWKAYMPKLYAGQRPTDFDDYRALVVAQLRRPGYARAFSLTTRTSHDESEGCLTAVSAPTLVLMGDKDPDFPDPTAEADWIGHALSAEVVIVPEAGHYPQSQRPDVTTNAVLRFLGSLDNRAQD
jgi:pimeloyl-ACP methyl ester carboxylesterase